MKAELIIACDGKTNDGFILCAGVSNVILDFESTQHLSCYHELINYFDINTGLFNGPCFSLNKITNALYKIFDLGVITKKQYSVLIQFFQMHKQCGIYLKIHPKES